MRCFIKSSNSTYWVVIPAAGVGVRMQADRPKQYLLLDNQPLLQRVVDVFSAIHCVQKIIVVLHAKDHWWPTLTFAHPDKVFTTIGGRERVDSVLLGLDFLKDFAHADDWVLVHDAARPFIQANDVMRLLHELQDHSVGGLFGLPVVDTLKQVNEMGDVQKTISRTQLWQAQTPQCFRYGVLKQSIEKALTDQKIVTDESSAIEYAGLIPKMILGNPRNRKVTFVEDLSL